MMETYKIKVVQLETFSEAFPNPENSLLGSKKSKMTPQLNLLVMGGGLKEPQLTPFAIAHFFE